jgi:hypothetical protein
MRANIFSLGVALVGAGALTACDSTGPADGNVQLGLMVSTTGSGAAAGAAFAPESVTVGQHRLVLTKVELVLREIELKRVAGSAVCVEDDGDGAPSFSSGDDGKSGGKEGEKDDDCLEVEIGPLLVDLPLGGGVKRVVATSIDTGSYRKVEFKIHKAGSKPDDQAFLTAHPDLAGISVRATGTYDGTPFVFTTGVSAKQEAELSPPLVVGAQGATDLTLQVEVASWFLAGGVGLVNPTTAAEGGPNRAVVLQNIRRSFKFFEDRNRNGKRDD